MVASPSDIQCSDWKEIEGIMGGQQGTGHLGVAPVMCGLGGINAMAESVDHEKSARALSD